MGLVLPQSLAVAAAGITVGLAAASVITRYLVGLLCGLTPLDPATFILAAVLFAVVAALASWVPRACHRRRSPCR